MSPDLQGPRETDFWTPTIVKTEASERPGSKKSSKRQKRVGVAETVFFLVSCVFVLCQKVGPEKKPININILGGTVSGTNRNRPWDNGPLPGTKWDPSLGQTDLSLFNSTVKSLFCPVCPWDGRGFVPGTIVPRGPSGKCLCVFCLLVFFCSQIGAVLTKTAKMTNLHSTHPENLSGYF